MITMHPGEYLKTTYLDSGKMSQKQLATMLGVNASTLSRLVTGKADLSPELALRLEASLDRSAESWIYMQTQYTLSVLRNKLGFTKREDKAPPSATGRGGRVVKLG